MNTHRASRFPTIKLMIVTSVLLAAYSIAILIPAALALISVRSTTLPTQAELPEVVNAFHAAINSADVDAVLALFTDDAVVMDGGSVFAGRDEIRNWVLYSQRMAGLRLTKLNSETHRENVIWLDIAHDGPEVQYRLYILRWEAHVRDGKIQSLTATPK